MTRLALFDDLVFAIVVLSLLMPFVESVDPQLADRPYQPCQMVIDCSAPSPRRWPITAIRRSSSAKTVRLLSPPVSQNLFTTTHNEIRNKTNTIIIQKVMSITLQAWPPILSCAQVGQSSSECTPPPNSVQLGAMRSDPKLFLPMERDPTSIRLLLHDQCQRFREDQTNNSSFVKYGRQVSHYSSVLNELSFFCNTLASCLLVSFCFRTSFVFVCPVHKCSAA